MRRLLPPDPAEIDLDDPYPGVDRTPPARRPWVLVNMVTTADGATTVDGVSGSLGGPADRAVFAALRRAADVVLAGAETVRAEGYGPARRRLDGSPGPRIAVVTASGRLDPASRLFAAADDADDPASRPLVLTCETCPPERRDVLSAVAEVVVVGADRVDLAAALAVLHERGARVVCGEGGPRLNGQLVELDLVDEWCITVDPSLAGGASARAAVGLPPPGGPRGLALDTLLEHDGVLFARYVRDRG